MIKSKYRWTLFNTKTGSRGPSYATRWLARVMQKRRPIWWRVLDELDGTLAR